MRSKRIKEVKCGQKISLEDRSEEGLELNVLLTNFSMLINLAKHS